MHKKREALTSFTQLTVHDSFSMFAFGFVCRGFSFWFWFSRRRFRVRVSQASPVFSPRWPRVCLAHVFANRSEVTQSICEPRTELHNNRLCIHEVYIIYNSHI